jgi:aminopeptidase
MGISSLTRKWVIQMNEHEFNRMLTKYADVTVRIGLNLRPGQCLAIRGILEDAPFIRKVVESAYKAGAKYVDVLWEDERTDRLFFEYANAENIESIPDWLSHRFEEYAARGDARLTVFSTDPDLLEGIDSDLIAKHRKAYAEKVSTGKTLAGDFQCLSDRCRGPGSCVARSHR